MISLMLLADRRIRIARAAKGIIAGLNNEQVRAMIVNASVPLLANELATGIAIYNWWRALHPNDSYAREDKKYCYDIECAFAHTIAKEHLDELKKFLDTELAPQLEIPSVTPKYESTYVGVLNKAYRTIVTVMQKKKINGHYGPSVLIVFNDKYKNIIKTFAKPEFADKVPVGLTCFLEGTISKHHVYGSTQETILKHATIDTDIQVKEIAAPVSTEL